MKRDFDDETTQIGWAFSKLGSVLSAIGIVLSAVGAITVLTAGQAKFKATPWTLAVAGLLVAAFILNGWGLSSRFKIYRKVPDAGRSALIVLSGYSGSQGEPITDPIDADVWYLYKWSWHRRHMHNAVEKLFAGSWLCIVIAIAVTIVQIAL